jgi:hypothetical protein
MFDVNLVAAYGFDDDAGLFHGLHYGLPVVRRKGTTEAGVKLARPTAVFKLARSVDTGPFGPDTGPRGWKETPPKRGASSGAR